MTTDMHRLQAGDLTTEQINGFSLDDAMAAAYERFLVPAMFDPWARVLVDVARLEPGERVIDVACGTGIVARHAASRVGASGTVCAVDPNAPMLAVGRATMPSGIDWHQAPAEQLPFAADAFDAAFCQQGLQFFAEPDRALMELRRVLRPGGRAVVAVWRSLPHSAGNRAMVEALDAHAGPAIGDMMRSPFALGDREGLRRLALQAGLVDVDIRIAVRLTRFASVEAFLAEEVVATPLAGPVGDLPEHVRAALLADLTDRMAPHVDDAGVAFPMETHLLTARA